MKTLACHRCQTPWDGADDWNATFKAGAVVGATCPACQTVKENTEAVVNEATLTYERDALGRVVGKARQ